MMTLKQYYLLKLIEECSEVQQRAAKFMQFGGDQIQVQSDHAVKAADGTVPSEQTLSNSQRLNNELNDLFTLVYIFQEDFKAIPIDTNEEFDIYYEAKKEKIKKFLKFSQELGLVGND